MYHYYYDANGKVQRPKNYHVGVFLLSRNNSKILKNMHTNLAHEYKITPNIINLIKKNTI